MQTIIKNILLAVCLLSGIMAEAQHALFLKQGNIQYEKKVNVLAVMKDRLTTNDIWGQKAVEGYESSGRSPFITNNFNLAFTDAKSLYTPIEGGDEKPNPFGFFQSAASDNIVYTDMDSLKSVASKAIYDENFMVTDSVRNIHWKITDETREIAGFQCRRANALIMDSIYVVAFYTNEILTPSGPESFSGLPGMILGVALPHLHMTWFATKVSVSPAVDKATLVPPTPRRKAITTTRKALFERLNKRLKEWGKQGNLIMQNALL